MLINTEKIKTQNMAYIQYDQQDLNNWHWAPVETKLEAMYKLDYGNYVWQYDVNWRNGELIPVCEKIEPPSQEWEIRSIIIRFKEYG